MTAELVAFHAPQRIIVSGTSLGSGFRFAAPGMTAFDGAERLTAAQVQGACRVWVETPDKMQTVLDDTLASANQRRLHQGRNIDGRTPVKAFADGLFIPTMEKVKSKPKSQIKIAA